MKKKQKLYADRKLKTRLSLPGQVTSSSLDSAIENIKKVMEQMHIISIDKKGKRR